MLANTQESEWPGPTLIFASGQENKWKAHELYAYIFKSYKSSFKLLNKIAFILLPG